MNDIAGWMTEAELDWLAMQAGRANVVLEIGVWKGRSTFCLCSACPGIVYAVDAWPFPAVSPAYWELHAEGIGREEIIKEARMNLAAHLVSGKLCLLEIESLTFLRTVAPILFKHRRPDLIFLDGDHKPELVRQEIELCMETLLARDGVLCGHDRNEVEPALRGLNYRAAVDSIWVLG